MRFNLPIKNRISVRWIYYLWLLLLLLSFVLQFTEQVPEWRFDRSLIDAGHYWLLLSGNIVHLNWSHWALNMAGLAIVAIFFTRHGNLCQWLLLLLVSSLFVSVGLYWLNPQIGTYVGLSGVLHGLFIFGAIREIRVYPLSGYALLLLLVGKLGWEFIYGAMPSSEQMIEGHVVTDAHLYGALGGLFTALLLSFRGLFDQLVQIKNR